MRITVEQVHALSGLYGNNIDWGYLHTNFNLEKTLKVIEQNKKIVGQLFTEFIIDSKLNGDILRKKRKIIFSEKEILITLKIMSLLLENIKWSLIDFKGHCLQEKLIRNHTMAGQKGTDFLISLMTNPELELV